MTDAQNPYEAPRADSAPQVSGSANEPPPNSPFDAVNRRFFRLLGDSGGPLIIIWGILAVLSLPGQLLNVAAQEAILSGDLNTMLALYLVIYPLAALSGALYSTSMIAMKRADDTDGDVTLMQAIDLTLSRVLSTVATMFLYGIAVFVGSMLCLLPGLYAAVMFAAAPFICAVYGYGPIESLKMSRDWVRSHFSLIAILMLAGVVYGIVLSILVMATMVAVFDVNLLTPGGGAANMGYIPTTMIWLMTSALGYFFWLYSGSVLITIGRAEERFMRPRDLFTE